MPVNLSYRPLTVERDGADSKGIADSTRAFNDAFRVGVALGHGMVYCETGGIFKISGRLEIDTNAVGFDGNGCRLDCSTVVDGEVWAPQQGHPDVNARTKLNAAHPIQNFTMLGPGNQN